VRQSPMSLSSLALAVALILNATYLVLAFAAYGQIKPAPRRHGSLRLLAFTFWWPFYDLYSWRATRLRIAGILVLVATVSAYVAAVRFS
jgi:hypothetical protein